MKQGCLLLSSLCLASSCTVLPEGHSWQPTLGIDRTVADDYELEVDISGLGSASGDVEYTATQVEFGATRIDETGDRPKKVEFAGLRIGFGELELDGVAADLLEISGWGRWYLGQSPSIQPFVSLWSVLSDLDDPLSDTPQLGLRFGGGAEVPITEALAFRGEVDYLIPLLAAEDETGLAESEGSGLAVRLGVSFRF
jgi:hypothetical protein